MPTSNGRYPRASSKELRVCDPENRLQMNVARATRLSIGIFECIIARRRKISLSVPFFLSIIPILLCRRVGRARNIIPCFSRYSVRERRLYSLSADRRLEAPCLHSQCFSYALTIVETLRSVTMVASVYRVPVSVMTSRMCFSRLYEFEMFADLRYTMAYVKSSCTSSLNASLTWVRETFLEGSGLPCWIQILQDSPTVSMAEARSSVSIPAAL